MAEILISKKLHIVIRPEINLKKDYLKRFQKLTDDYLHIIFSQMIQSHLCKLVVIENNVILSDVCVRKFFLLCLQYIRYSQTHKN